MPELDELLALSNTVGQRPDWVQAAGGNTSVKSADTLFVKASGSRLREMNAQKGWVALDLSSARAVLENPDYDALPHAAQQDKAGADLLKSLRPESPQGRPSLEAEFHLLGPRVCLHLHIIELLAGLALKDGRAWFEAAFGGSGLNWAWVDYRPPGHSLAKLVQTAFRENPGCNVVLMKNHGAIFYSASVMGAVSLAARAQDACIKALGSQASDVEATSPWMPLCPDDVIYASPSLPPAKDERALSFRAEMKTANAKAVALAQKAGEIEPLSPQQCAELLGMDGEKYRQGLK